jgi:hypothetical protein
MTCHCSTTPTLEDVFELCCDAFDQCQMALMHRDHEAFMRAREVHQGYAELHRHMADGGRIQ